MSSTYDAIVRGQILPLCDRIAKRGQGFMVRCPTHDDGTASLSISPGRDQPVVLHCHAGCHADDVLRGFGLTWEALSRPREDTERRERAPWMTCMIRDGEPVRDHAVKAEYDYTDEHGTLIRGVSRCVQKCFRQWRPDPAKRSGRTWRTTLDDGTEVGADLIYRLPEVLANLRRPFLEQVNIWVVEGEKDANRLWSLGHPATTNPQGAGKWMAGHAAWLAGADVVIVADRDTAGEQHARTVVETLMPIARSIEVVQAAEGKDISDHIDAGLPLRQRITVWMPLPAADADATAAEYEALRVH
ncbi:hypothetical protein [Dactylosporangium sp. NPDC051484]|uniref:hypothetical protein n=1 Tax=Dactylosporangium sp. NPDC051484 TaxID=3154942 RepID=UPI00344B52B6